MHNPGLRVPRSQLLHHRNFAPHLVVPCIAVLAATMALLMPVAYFTIDEAHYHLMADSLVDEFRFDIPNRLDALAAPEMTPFLAVDVNGRITSQYPHLYAFLAAPFEMAFGMRGLYLLNAAAYVAVLAVTYATAVRLLRDRSAAALAVCVFAFATFSLQYAAAIWPHMLASAFVVVAIFAILRSNESHDQSAGLLWAGAAGLCLGIGMGVRLDVAFAGLPAAGLLLLERRWATRGGVCAAAVAPCLAAMAAINFVKFGTFLPFSYGIGQGGYVGGIVQYLPIVAALMIAIAVVAGGPFLWRRFQQAASPQVASYAPIIAGVLGSGILVALLAYIGPRFFDGLLQIVVDLRLRPLELIEPAMVRTPDGSVFYHLSAKKALLQSCPFLFAVGLDAVRRLRIAEERQVTIILLMPVAVYVSVFSYFAWHGGLSYNMRYLTPILPFVAILSAQTFIGLLRELGAHARRYIASIWPLSALAMSVLGWEYIFLPPRPTILADQDWWQGHVLWMLRLPLWIAVIAGSFWLLRYVAPARWRMAGSAAAAIMFAIALGSSSVAALAHDLFRTAAFRGAYEAEANALSAALPPDSLLVTTRSYSHLYSLLADHGVYLAAINRAPSRPLRALMEPFARRGYETYLYGTAVLIDRLCGHGALSGIDLRAISTHGEKTLYRAVISASKAINCAARAEPIRQKAGGGS